MYIHVRYWRMPIYKSRYICVHIVRIETLQGTLSSLQFPHPSFGDRIYVCIHSVTMANSQSRMSKGNQWIYLLYLSAWGLVQKKYCTNGELIEIHHIAIWVSNLHAFNCYSDKQLLQCSGRLLLVAPLAAIWETAWETAQS